MIHRKPLKGESLSILSLHIEHIAYKNIKINKAVESNGILSDSYFASSSLLLQRQTSDLAPPPDSTILYRIRWGYFNSKKF